jgi:hypothetical protein
MTTQSPVQRTRSRRPERDLSAVDVNPRADGSYGVLSSSGETIYTVRLSAEGNTCTCPAGQRDVPCYHVAAVCLRDAQARTCAWCPTTSAACEVFVNGWDNGAELVLCPTCAPVQAVR